MSATELNGDILDPESLDFYVASLKTLQGSGIPYLVGGAFALNHYTGIVRHTKDFDIFVRPDDCPRILDLFARQRMHTELTFPHWLGKVYHDDHFIDVIFSSGNGSAPVDDGWFAHAPEAQILGRPVRVCPVEEMIWQKAYIMERERFDGADVAHLLRARAAYLDWDRLVERFGPHWRVLLAHLVLFGFIYPGERGQIPARTMDVLLARVREEAGAPPGENHVCQGTLLSREQYLTDLQSWGYRDPRLRPEGNLTRGDAKRWTDAIEDHK